MSALPRCVALPPCPRRSRASACRSRAAARAMPAGPLLGVAWQSVLRRPSREPPRVLLLAPARERAYPLAAHRAAAAAEPQPQDEVAAVTPAPSDAPVGGLKPRIGARTLFFALMCWLTVGLRAVPVYCVAFAVAFPAYLLCANALRFERNAQARDKPTYPLLIGARCVGRDCASRDAPCSPPGTRSADKTFPLFVAEVPLPAWFKRYVLSFALATVLLPLLTIIAAPVLLGAAAGAAVQRATGPPLFLLLAQLFMEATTEAASRDWAALVRILNPIGFNAFRLYPLFQWVASSAGLAAGAVAAADAPLHARAFVLCVAVLAGVNACLWLYNLFVFLLLTALPHYLDASRFAT